MKDIDKKTLKFLNNYYSSFSDNGKASTSGYLGECILCDILGWKQIDGDGYDAETEEISYVKVGFQILKDTTRTVRLEIKTMTDNTDTHILPYSSESKKGKHHYLVVYFFTHDRVSIIPHDELEDLLSQDGVGKTINLNPGIRHNHSKPVYSPLTKLFFKHELDNFKTLLNER
tara:strand:+ start:382 stop:900 length:519 start_codon:yes stop_codon:yes gene_type:complete